MTNFNKDIFEVPENTNYMEDIVQTPMNTCDENDASLLTQPSRTKNYLARKTAGVQKRKNNNTFVPTVPKPFKFHTASRVNISRNEDSPQRTPFIPLAIKVKQFMENTPKLDHGKAVSKHNNVRSNELTVPRSPLLRTKYRTKNATTLPTEERVVREIQNYRFKANPVDRRIFERDVLRVPQVQKLKLTEPHSPFITKPKPPRSRSPSPPHLIKANPVPDHKDPFRPMFEHRFINVSDFRLPGEEISKRKSQEIEERIRLEREKFERMREFRARPLPTNSPDCLPPRHHYTPTYPKPFTLLTDCRGERYQMEFNEKLREEERERENDLQFHAQPVPSFEPEILKRPECPPPTEAIGFFFQTDIRMEERHLFDEQRRLRDKEAEEQKEQKLREEEARQAEEIRRLRVELVHHAQPIRYYSPIIIQPSNKKPTRPVSPMIGDKRFI
ncbi:8306_t:CDS:2 [Funneliformis caledonium]|uniref:8306_t:CDS:1 n=1 Tax=Funneliformis caledonium TaxID=1117310 RepID=A0A9N8W3H3_9GLOM|nr:8306_t:CDS:2 [Funneliformis caledonium]